MWFPTPPSKCLFNLFFLILFKQGLFWVWKIIASICNDWINITWNFIYFCTTGLFFFEVGQINQFCKKIITLIFEYYVRVFFIRTLKEDIPKRFECLPTQVMQCKNVIAKCKVFEIDIFKIQKPLVKVKSKISLENQLNNILLHNNS